MVPQLWRVQCRLDESFVIDAKPLNEKASVTLAIGEPCHVAGIAR